MVEKFPEFFILVRNFYHGSIIKPLSPGWFEWVRFQGFLLPKDVSNYRGEWISHGHPIGLIKK